MSTRIACFDRGANRPNVLRSDPSRRSATQPRPPQRPHLGERVEGVGYPALARARVRAIERVDVRDGGIAVGDEVVQGAQERGRDHAATPAPWRRRLLVLGRLPCWVRVIGTNVWRSTNGATDRAPVPGRSVCRSPRAGIASNPERSAARPAADACCRLRRRPDPRRRRRSSWRPPATRRGSVPPRDVRAAATGTIRHDGSPSRRLRRTVRSRRRRRDRRRSPGLQVDSRHTSMMAIRSLPASSSIVPK
jgi:hypothetical protein